MLNLVFSSLSDPAIAHCINQNELVPSKLLPKHQNSSSLIWVWWDKDLAKCTSQGYVYRKGERREIWKIKGWRLWMSQSCFSLGFFSQNSLWKLSTFRGYKGIYSKVYEECEMLGFKQTRHSGDSASRLERVMSLSRELTAWPDWKLCPVVLQLAWPFSSPCMLHTCAILATF